MTTFTWKIKGISAENNLEKIIDMKSKNKEQ